MWWATYVGVVVLLVAGCTSDVVMDMLAPFIDVETLVEEAASLVSEANGVRVAVDDTFPLAPVELQALLKIYNECRTPQSVAMRTWCIGNASMDGNFERCPPGIRTHPCTGRVLDVNGTQASGDVQYFWPWKGIKCDAFTEPTTITNIYLPNESLSCRLAELDLSVMVSLEQLDLSRNQLHGEFPEWLGEMTMLRLLNLQGNEVEGDILPSFANNNALELINLSENQLTASTVSFFDAFRRLQHLDLSYNFLTLELSNGMFASEFLLSANLSHNGFRGVLPDLPKFKYLTSLDLSDNYLTGMIPAQLSLWGREDPHDPDESSVLSVVDVSNNMFTGDLPVISNLTELRLFDVHNNNFSGLVPDFPPSLLSSINPAYFAGNGFLCPLPVSLAESNLTCTCGDGFGIKFQRASVTTSSNGSDYVLSAKESLERCKPCPGGYYSNATTDQACITCPPGSSPASKRADRCTLCHPGTFANESGSRVCKYCPAGTFVDYTGAHLCELCNPGEFTSGEGSVKCSLCPSGAFSDVKGATSCNSCPAGSYTAVEGEAECQLCLPNTYQDETGAVQCKECPTGFAARSLGHVKCLPCLPGSFYNSVTKVCTLCSPGTYSAGGGQSSCSSCGNGTITESYGSEKCLATATSGWGYKSPDLPATPVKCDPGTFNDGKGRICRPCPQGTFAMKSGARGCSACPKGSFAPSEGLVQCKKSPVGSFVDVEGAIRSKPCPPNHVASSTGSTVCTPCALPSFSFLYGGTNCSVASVGEVYESVEWPQIALVFYGFDLSELRDGDDEQFIADILEVWTITLTGYSVSTQKLHLLQATEDFTSDKSLNIVVAVEILENRHTTSVGISTTAAESIETALDDILDDLGASSVAADDSQSDQLVGLVTTDSFRDALARQFEHTGLLNESLSSKLLNISIEETLFTSTRAVPCPPGAFFSLSEDSSSIDTERECQPCPAGSFIDTSGALMCTLCRRGTFSAMEGAAECAPCPMGADSSPGATTCVECSWFTYECEGFWWDVVLAAGASVLLLWKIYSKIRRFCEGDRELQQQIESEALLAAVRTHGRSFDGVQYAPMGVISADTLIGRA